MSTIVSTFKRDGLACALLAPLLVGLTPSARTAAFAEPRMAAVASASQGHDLSALPLAAQASISAVLGRDDARYHVIAQEDRLHAENPSQALAADFTPQGVELRSGTARWRLSLSGYGRGSALSPVSGVAPEAVANRVEYRHGALTEWYLNGPLGLEQGFTLEAAPGVRAKGDLLTLVLEVSADIQPSLDANGAGLTLHLADGQPALRYAGLSAADADGRRLLVWLNRQGGAQLRLLVDDAGARYPLLIDPMVQRVTGKAKLRASDGVWSDWFGSSVAISGDIVVVGAPYDQVGGNNHQGSAYVFVEPVGGWGGHLNETAKLTASDGAAYDEFGISVAISGDAVVAGAEPDAAYVFVKPAGGWSGDLNETAKLTASDPVGKFFGHCVATSGDTVVVGANGAYVGQHWAQGSAYVFVEPSGGWAGHLTETAKLRASDGGEADGFGISVAIDGDTLVVAANGEFFQPYPPSSAYVFVEPVGGWGGHLNETAKLTASDGEKFDGFGLRVAIDGDTVVVGAGTHGGSQGGLGPGAAYVFVEPVGGWGGHLNETAMLTASDGEDNDGFGAVAIDGDTIVVGAGGDTNGEQPSLGSIYLFVEPVDGWAGHLTETAKLKVRNTDPHAFGGRLALSGQTVVAGAPGDVIYGDHDPRTAYVIVFGR